MRSSYTGGCAIVCLVSALLAGCAGAPQGVPVLSEPSQPGAIHQSGVPAIASGRIGAVQLLELEIAGTIQIPVARPVLLRTLEEINGYRRVHETFSRNAAVGLWAAVSAEEYIFGQNSKGNKTVTAIDTESNGCLEPYSIKVDHAENLWIACYESDGEGGEAQEYAPGSSTPLASFPDTFGCGSNCFFLGTPFDVATDSRGHVFAANAFSEECRSSCTDGIYPVVWWNAKSPSSPPTAIKDSDLTDGDYVDVDTSGNIYVDGHGCIGSKCGFLLDEIRNPPTTPTITNLMPPSASSGFLSLYISNAGRVLNLVDSATRTISQFALPWISGESPFNVLGPTLTNYFGEGYPDAGGFNRTEKLLAIGDADGWLDIGKVVKNRWSIVTNVNLFQGVSDTAYVPSDK